jgi:hypothetical protein
MNLRSRIKKRWLLLAAAIFGVALLGSGVFASSQIVLNSGNAVSLGAGAAAVNTPCGTATISTQQYFNSSQQAYYTGTISLDIPSSHSTCTGKTLSLAYDNAAGVSGSATWAVDSGNTYTYGSAANSGGTSRSSGLLSAFNTAAANLATIAVAAQ